MHPHDKLELLREHLKAHITHGDFTLSSGLKSTWYLDIREVALSYPRLVGDVVAAFSPLKSPVIFAGVNFGGTPIAVAAASSSPSCVSVVVREPKEHGRQRVVEGSHQYLGTRPLVLIDDVFTTGTSIKRSADLLWMHHMISPDAYFVVFNRNPNLQGITDISGKPFKALFNLRDLGLR
jgi:orotate phosphoribosyltransferase